MTTLTGRRVLIVEDDHLVGAELARAFAGLGAVVLGPTPCLWRAEILGRAAEAAVLDIGGEGAAVRPLAERLRRRGIPVVVYSSSGEAGPSGDLDGACLLNCTTAPLPADLLAGSPPSPPADMIAILPKLRLISQRMAHDPIAADRLVENTLRAALDEIEARDGLEPLDDWLVALLQRQGSRHGTRMMN